MYIWIIFSGHGDGTGTRRYNFTGWSRITQNLAQGQVFGIISIAIIIIIIVRIKI